MRAVLQIFAGFILAISALLSILGLFALGYDPSSQQAFDAEVLAGLVGFLLFAGILWMLVDISNALHPEVEKGTVEEEKAER